MNEPNSGEASLERRVAREHAQLEPLFEATRSALQRDSSADALESVAALRNAIEGHTAQEDRLYYPALWSLCPQYKHDLQAFIRSHEGFRQALDEIVRCISGSDLPAAAEHFEAFSASFATHEVFEEEVLRKIDAENPWEASPSSP